MRRHWLLTLAALANGASHARQTAPARLAPPQSHIGYTVYAFGLIPFTAQFRDFTGTLTTDPQAPASCTVQVTVRIASLRTEDPDRDRQALGASMLDAPHYPTMDFTGHCAPDMLVGALTLHGVTRSLTLALRRTGRRVTATGTLLRRDYNITGMPGLVGQRIHIRLDALLPEPG